MKKFLMLCALTTTLSISTALAAVDATHKANAPTDPNLHMQNQLQGKTIPEKIECDKELSTDKHDCKIEDKNLKNNKNNDSKELLNDRIN